MAARSGVVCACALALASPVYSQTDTTRAVKVTAEGLAYATPDVAFIDLVAKYTSDTMRVAREGNRKALETLLDALRKAGVEGKDIRTKPLGTHMSREESYAHLDGLAPRLPATHETDVTVVRVAVEGVTLPHLEKAWKVVDAAVGAGAQLVRETSSYASIRDEMKTFLLLGIREGSALEKTAVQDGLLKAGRLALTCAEAAGVTIAKAPRRSEVARAKFEPVGMERNCCQDMDVEDLGQLGKVKCRVEVTSVYDITGP